MDDKRLLKIIEKRQIKLPKKSVAMLLTLVLKLKVRKYKPKYVYDFDVNTLKGKQIVLIGDHSSRNVFYYLLNGYRYVDPNVVVGFHNIFGKGTFRLLLSAGVILKSLYEPDTESVKQMLKVIKMGGSLCFFPEGIQSTSGSTHPMNPTTIKFLKKVGLDVVHCKSYGAYLANPRYSKETKKGVQEFHYELLFTKEELKEKTEEQLYEKYLEHFSFNDFKWNKIARNKYIGKESNAKGIEKILYYCPKCQTEFNLTSKNDLIECECCGNKIKVNEYYDLIPQDESICPFESIDEWFKYQRRLVKEEVNNTDISITYDVILRGLYFDKIRKVQEQDIGCGKVTINEQGLRYVGTKFNENVDILYNIERMPSFVFTPGKDNAMYYNREYLMFKPIDNPLKTVKYMLYVEQLHNKKDPLWDKVSRDVYE